MAPFHELRGAVTSSHFTFNVYLFSFWYDWPHYLIGNRFSLQKKKMENLFEKILENAAKEQAADLDQPERGSSEGEAGAVHQGAAHISLHREVHRAGPDQEDVRGKVLSDGGRKCRPLEVQTGKEKTAGEVTRTRTVAEEKRKQYLEIWQQKKAVDKNKKKEEAKKKPGWKVTGKVSQKPTKDFLSCGVQNSRSKSPSLRV